MLVWLLQVATSTHGMRIFCFLNTQFLILYSLCVAVPITLPPCVGYTILNAFRSMNPVFLPECLVSRFRIGSSHRFRAARSARYRSTRPELVRLKPGKMGCNQVPAQRVRHQCALAVLHKQ